MLLQDSERYSTFSRLYMYNQPALATVIPLNEDRGLEMTIYQRLQGSLAYHWG